MATLCPSSRTALTLGCICAVGLSAACADPSARYVCTLPLTALAQPAAAPAEPDGGAAGEECQALAAPRNLFAEVLGQSASASNAKVEAAFQSLFYGGKDRTVYYPVGADQAYILDVHNDDVRTEGMSYGMMIAVQLDKKAEFDRLWTWAKLYMYQSSGPLSGYFVWHRTAAGAPLSDRADMAAPDGEEYFATALILASQRWGNGTGIFDYAAEARSLLDVMIHKGEDPAAQAAGITSMFDPTHKLVVFVPATWAPFTDPSYVMPAFYDLWACFDAKNRDFWREVAATSRAFFPKVTDPVTGLAPEYASFDGTPSTLSGRGDFRFDAWRVAMNVMIDLHLRGVDPWQPAYAARLGTFFATQGNYGNQYTLSGTKLASEHTAGLVAVNGMLGFGLEPACSSCFVQPLWDMAPPTGPNRYYSGLLYLLALLHASGNFRLGF